MENVHGIFLDTSKSYLQDVVANLLSLGYQVRVDLLNASSYGDPQNRKRVILFAARKEILLPSKLHPTRGPNLLPVKTCEDAIGMLEKFVPSNSTSGVISLSTSTLIYNHVISRGKRRHDDWTLKANEPARTVLATSRPHVHYNGKRGLSVREGEFSFLVFFFIIWPVYSNSPCFITAACLQSFPLTYVFCGSVDRQFSQVGNAVPVCLATAIARSFAMSYGIDC
jgi:DNA (cytosine-5)-methyltransferase 1